MTGRPPGAGPDHSNPPPGRAGRPRVSGDRPGPGARLSNGEEPLLLPGDWPEPVADDGDSEGALPPQPMYGSVEAWVTGQFLPMFRRPLGGEYRWCSQWWQHAEAITRLTALWHSWETLRLEPGTGMAAWLRDHLDHQLPVLLGRGGPFAQCSEDEHIEPREARTQDAPPGWWDPGAPEPGDGGGGAS